MAHRFNDNDDDRDFENDHDEGQIDNHLFDDDDGCVDYDDLLDKDLASLSIGQEAYGDY